MTPLTPTYTANRFAVCLGKSPQAIRKALRNVKPSGVVIVNGREADAWEIEILPAQMRDDLAAAALQRRFRDVVAMLSNPPARWEPPIPLGEIVDAEIVRAGKLRQRGTGTPSRNAAE